MFNFPTPQGVLGLIVTQFEEKSSTNDKFAKYKKYGISTTFAFHPTLTSN